VTTVECPREGEVLEALAAGQWPERAADDLRGHAAACEICSDLVEVAGPLLAERGRIPEDANIPSSAVMWWRAQMRARQEAAREAARPITVAQIVAITAALVLVCGVLYSMAPWLRAWFSNRLEIPSFDLRVTMLADGPIVPTFVMVIAGAMLLLAPVAVYFALREDRG
jgi:hypothetical protein